MATYVLIHGAGDVSWYWHLVEAELRSRHHDVVAVDLPCADEDAGLGQYAETVVAAISDRKDLIVVGQSFAGYSAPLVCAHLPVDLLVLVAAMIPSPGESAAEMFANTGYQQEPQEDPSDIAVFYHDLPLELAEEALARGQGQAGKPFREPWPLPAWPDVPTRFILARNDRLFPAAWLRKVAIERLGVIPDEIAAGHCIALSKPIELVEMLESCRTALRPTIAGIGIGQGI